MSRNGVMIVDGLVVEVTFRRVKRMNVRVHPPDGAVRMSVPPRTSQRTIERFLRASRDWVEQQRRRIEAERLRAELEPGPPVRVGASGEIWWRFGHAYRLDVRPVAGPAQVRLVPDGRLVVHAVDPADGPAVLRLLDRWGRRELRAAATPLLDVWARRMGVRYDFLGLRRMSTRWGSCVPARRRIWLNVALVTRRPALLEYVVVHELAHLTEASHGPAFRAVMDGYLPDWRSLRRDLDRSG